MLEKFLKLLNLSLAVSAVHPAEQFWAKCFHIFKTVDKFWQNEAFDWVSTLYHKNIKNIKKQIAVGYAIFTSSKHSHPQKGTPNSKQAIDLDFFACQQALPPSKQMMEAEEGVGLATIGLCEKMYQQRNFQIKQIPEAP